MPPDARWNDEPPSKRERERLRREARRARMRRADAAVARRRQERSSPFRVLAFFVVLVGALAGIAVAFVSATRDEGGVSGSGTAATAPGPGGGGAAEPPAPISFVWVGDITLGSKYGLPPDDGRALFAGVRDILRNADVTLGNLEGVLSVGGVSKCPSTSALPSATATTTTPSAPPACFAFQAPPGNAAALQGAGFDVMNLANDHALDFGEDGRKQTIQALDRFGILHTGRPGAITVKTVAGRRVAFVGFAPYGWANRIGDLARATALVKKAARQADLVVVTMHAGAEGADQIHTPKGHEFQLGEDRGPTIAFAHAAVDAGADLVLGSGPHVVRGIERYHGRLIAYSLGTFAGYHSFGTGGNLSLSGILRVRLGPDGQVLDGRWFSIIVTGPGIPEPDRDHASAQLVDDLSREDFDGVYHMTPTGRIGG